MKRPVLVTVLFAAHAITALLFGGVAVYLLFLTRSPEILKESDAAETVHALRLGAVVVGITVFPLLVSMAAIIRRWFWGGWYSLLIHVGFASIFIFDMIDEHAIDEAEMIIAAVCLAIAALYVTGPVRRYFSGKSRAQKSDLVAGAGI
jgi:hypothetical protein